jgi:hypothetical protein
MSSELILELTIKNRDLDRFGCSAFLNELQKLFELFLIHLFQQSGHFSQRVLAASR